MGGADKTHEPQGLARPALFLATGSPWDTRIQRHCRMSVWDSLGGWAVPFATSPGLGTDTELPGSATSSLCGLRPPHPSGSAAPGMQGTFTSCRSWWDNWLWGSLSFWVIHGCCRTCLAVRRWWGST